MTVLTIVLLALFGVVWGFFEIIILFEEGSPIPEKDISDYLDKIEKKNLINGVRVSKRWNDKFTLNVNGFDNPSIHKTQFSLLFPYHIGDVGVIPVWSKSYTRIKNLFKENIENSSYQTNKRKKLGLD